MSHFYGVLSGLRGDATRCGTAKSGLTVKAMSWSGCVRVDLTHDAKTGKDSFTVEQTQHPSTGAGIRETIAEGIIGQPIGKADLIEALKDAAAELIRLHDNEDLTDIARPDETIIAKIQDVIKKAEG